MMTPWSRADLDLFDRYVKEELSDAERSDFETRLRSDDEFKKSFADYQQLIRELQNREERDRLRRLLDEAHGELSSEPAPRRSPERVERKSNRWIYRIAASIALLMIVGIYFVTQSLRSQQEMQYSELRRNVAQIQKSQSKIMNDLATEKKGKAPGKFGGTGFLISTGGFVATSYHVVREQDSILIENEKYGTLRTTVYYTDEANDLAVLRIEPGTPARFPLPYPIARKESALAEEVFTLGYPREEIVYGTGAISAVSGYNGNPGAYQVSVPVNPGNSGGPLFSGSGELVGIISGKQNEVSGAAFAVKSHVLLTLLEETMPDSLRVPLVRSAGLRGSSRVEQVKRLKDCVFMVRVYKN